MQFDSNTFFFFLENLVIYVQTLQTMKNLL